jgi:hypothetical protein
MRSFDSRKFDRMAVRDLLANAQNVTVLNVPTTTTLWAGTTGFATAGLLWLTQQI